MMKNNYKIKFLAAILILLSFNGCSFKNKEKIDYSFIVGENYKGHLTKNGIVYSYNNDNTAYLLTSENKSISKVEIKSSINVDNVEYKVTKIFNNAFNNCKKINSIVIPDSVIEIGNNAFANCVQLTSISLSNSLIEIGDRAFENCNKLEHLELKENVSKIGYYSFINCDKLTSFDVASNNLTYKSLDGVLYTLDNSLVQYPLGKTNKDFIVPDGVNKIEDGAFAYSKNIEMISLNAVKKIGNYAFSNCYKLNKIDFGDCLEIISDGAFSSCVNLNYAELPNTLTNIGNYAFHSSTYLYGVKIPNTVTYVGKDVFSNCNSIIIYCEANVNTLNWDSNWNSDNHQVYKGVTDQNVCILSGIVYQLANDVAYVLGHSKVIKTITIPDIINYQGYRYNVTEIKHSAFENDSNVESVNIGNNIVSIDTYSFNECKNLKELTIGDGNVRIEYNAFNGCKSLKNISLGNNVQRISSTAFKDVPHSAFRSYSNAFYLGNNNNPYLYLIKATTKSISSCKAHEETRIIADEAFYSCSNLKDLTIYNKLIFIGNYSIYNCSSLKSIKFIGTKDEWANIEKGTRWNSTTISQVVCSNGIATVI